MLYAILRYMQASEKQMEKPLPGIRFGRLATGTKMGVTCMPRHSLQNAAFHPYFYPPQTVQFEKILVSCFAS